MKMDDTTFRKKKVLNFPYLYIRELTDNIAFLVTSIPKGELPIVTTKEGRLRAFANITRDPVYLQLFIEQYNPILVKSKTEKIPLNSIKDYMREVTSIWEA